MQSCGLSWSDHQLQATRPGLIQLVSFTTDGGLTSVTRVDSTMSAGESPTTITRQGVVQGKVDAGLDRPHVIALGRVGESNAIDAVRRLLRQTAAAVGAIQTRLRQQGPAAAVAGAKEHRKRPAELGGRGRPGGDTVDEIGLVRGRVFRGSVVRMGPHLPIRRQTEAGRFARHDVLLAAGLGETVSKSDTVVVGPNNEFQPGAVGVLEHQCLLVGVIAAEAAFAGQHRVGLVDGLHRPGLDEP